MVPATATRIATRVVISSVSRAPALALSRRLTDVSVVLFMVAKTNDLLHLGSYLLEKILS